MLGDSIVTQSPNTDNRIDLVTFLTRRIVAIARLSIGASPSRRTFWQGQITSYHAQLRQAITGGAR